jgi:hAT family protein
MHQFWQAWQTKFTQDDLEIITLAQMKSPTYDQSKKSRHVTLTAEKAKAQSIADMSARVFGEWKSREALDEYSEYISESTLEVKKPLAWWCESNQRQRWPVLSQLAISLLSIPPMSDEAERVFSGTRRTISWERSRLGLEAIEAIECLKHHFIGQRSRPVL